MGDSGPLEVFDKTENEEIGTVDQPKSDKSDEDIPQDTSNQINRHKVSTKQTPGRYIHDIYFKTGHFKTGYFKTGYFKTGHFKTGYF